MAFERFVEPLPCALTPEEILGKSKHMSQLAKERATLVQKKKDVASEYKMQIAEKDAKISGLVEEVHTGQELRPIECVEKPRYRDNVVEIRRMDTGEVVRTRGMEPEERQTGFEEMGELPPKKTRAPKRGKGSKAITDESTH